MSETTVLALTRCQRKQVVPRCMVGLLQCLLYWSCVVLYGAPHCGIWSIFKWQHNPRKPLVILASYPCSVSLSAQTENPATVSSHTAVKTPAGIPTNTRWIQATGMWRRRFGYIHTYIYIYCINIYIYTLSTYHLMPLNAIIYHTYAGFLPTLNRPLVVSCQLLVAPGPGGPGPGGPGGPGGLGGLGGPGGPGGPGPGSCRYAARRAWWWAEGSPGAEDWVWVKSSSHDGSMVLVYMLAWLGCVYIYIYMYVYWWDPCYHI